MAWIESHQSLATHRKTLALKRLLGISRATVIGHLHLLWWWCLDNAPDGNLQSIDPSDLAAAMDWSGDPNTIIGALVSVGYLEKDLKVHGWGEYAQKLIERRIDNARRNRELRERNKLIALPSHDNHESITLQSRDALQYSTVQYSTEHNKNIKKGYGEFKNVLLTDEEYEKLKVRFATTLSEKIETMSLGIETKGYKYRSHYAAILSWDRRDKKQKPTPPTKGYEYAN